VRLLERTSRRVALTPAGAVLLEQGRIAVEAAGAAAERTRRAGLQPRRLTVAVKPGTGTGLPQKIMQRCAQDPRCRRCASWPGTSRSRAVAGFVRATIEVAASHAEQPATLA